MMEKPFEFTRAIARFVVGTADSSIPQHEYEHAKVAFMDWVAVTLAGRDQELVEKLIHYSDLMGGHEQASVLGRNMKKSLSQAALINGSASHALDYDDSLKQFLGHPSVTLFPGLLALAEWNEKKGKDFLTAYIIGFQAGTAIAASAGMGHYMSGWHATSTIGHLASAAGCARLLGLDEQQAVHALGIAGTQACGLKRVFGSMCKPFHAGRSSQAGLMAALLAEDGFNSADDILEGPLGFFQVLGGQADSEVIGTLGRKWDLENLAQKYHASCHATHSPIEGVLSILEKEGLSGDDIMSIKINSSRLSLDAAGNLEPKTGLEGKFSIPYCVANAVLRNHTGMQAFTDEKVHDPGIREFMKKIDLSLDENMQALEATVVVKTVEGEEYSGFADILEQVPDLELKRKKIGEKFQDLCEPVLGKETTKDLGNAISVLEGIENVKAMVEQLICRENEAL